jgi:colicin import membrane protein
MKETAMANPTEVRDNARRKANNHFTAAEARDTLVKNELQKERAAFETKTAKLKALRLAKEAADAVEEERLALIKAAAKAMPRKPAAKTSAKTAAKPVAKAAKKRG